jgi:iron complex transport system substrate-binding protein
VAVPLQPRRIVSLAPSVTEMLFALSAGERVVGITDFCDYPREASGLPRIGGLIHPDLERIMALRPDLAIASTAGNYLEDAERLERLGVPVYTAASGSVEQTLQSFLSVGELLGLGPQAQRVVEALKARLAAVQKAAAGRPRLPTLYVIEPDPLVVPGRGTFLEEALAMAGADLVTREAVSGWAQFDLERVVELRPQVILTASANKAWAETAGTRAIWKELPAAREGRIYVISDSIQHPGPRLVDGVEEVAALLSGEKEPGGRPPRP